MAPIPPQFHVTPLRCSERQGARPSPRPFVVIITFCLLMVAFSSPALAADWVATGFQLDQLVSAAGVGPDPGPGDPVARLDWAVQVTVPIEWRNAVAVRWEIGHAGRGHLALSYLNGVVVVSERLLIAYPEALLATVAHEMGHHIAFQLVSPGDGSPPSGFSDIRGPGYRDIREAWADCVGRVWTGSLRRTVSEPEPCPVEAAQWVAGQLSTPGILGGPEIGDRAVRPRVIPPPPVPPPPVPSPSAAPTQTPPEIQPPRPGPRVPKDTPSPADEGLSMGTLAAIMVLVPAALGLAGAFVIKRRFTPGHARASTSRQEASPASSAGDKIRKLVGLFKALGSRSGK